MHIGLRSRLPRNLAEDNLIGLIFQAIGGMTRCLPSTTRARGRSRSAPRSPGTVAEIGEGVQGLRVGDPVVVRPLDPRGETPADRGFPHIGRNLKFLGIDA